MALSALLCLSTTGLHSFQVFLLVLLLRLTGKFSTWVGVCFSTLSWVWGGRTFQFTLSFPNRLSNWEGLWATLILGFELTRWLCVAQQDFIPCTGFALGAIYSAVLFLSSGTTGPHSFQDLSASFSQMGLEGTSAEGGMGFSPLSGHIQTRLYGWQNSLLRIWIRQICIRPSSLVRGPTPPRLVP